MNTLAHRIVDALAQALGPGPRPPVQALHLPPTPWNGSKDGEFGALALADGSLGLAYLLLDDALARLAGGEAGEGLAGADPLDIARWWVERDGAARTLGFAAVNALTRHLFDRHGWVPPDAPDSIAGLDPQPGEAIGMVGYFPPLLKQVTARGARLTVLELRADLVGEQDGVRVTLDPAELAPCRQVLVTSTTLLNHSLERVLAACHGARRIALIGPGAGLWPAPLFAAGVTALGGSWIVDGPGFAAALRRGEPWGRHARKTLLDAATWARWTQGQSAP